MTQAPAAVFHQPAAPKPQAHGLPTWRPQHVQQLPLAAPSKPASLAHQLGGTIQFNRVPTLGLPQHTNQFQGMPRQTQYQQPQPWQHRQPWATSQYSTNRQAPQPHLRPQQVQQQHQQLPLASPGPLAPVAAAESSAHAPFNQVPPAAAALADDAVPPIQQGMQPTQALVPNLLQQELERLRKDLAAQAGMTTQLRHKVQCSGVWFCGLGFRRLSVSTDSTTLLLLVATLQQSIQCVRAGPFSEMASPSTASALIAALDCTEVFLLNRCQL